MRKFLSRAFMNAALIGSALGLPLAAEAQSRAPAKLSVAVQALSLGAAGGSSWFNGVKLEYNFNRSAYVSIGVSGKSLYSGLGIESSSIETFGAGVEVGGVVSDKGSALLTSYTTRLGYQDNLNGKLNLTFAPASKRLTGTMDLRQPVIRKGQAVWLVPGR